MSKQPGKKSHFGPGVITVGLYGKKYRSKEKAVKALNREAKKGRYFDLFSYAA